MRTLLTCVVLTLMIPFSVSAQDSESSEAFKLTTIEAGPSLSLPLRGVRFSTSFGIGADLKISGPLTILDENLFVGGRFIYDALIGKDTQSGFKGNTVHNFAFMASAEYTYNDMFVAEGNLGLGISSGRFNTFGVARSLFIGYKFADLARPIKVGWFISRITLSTLHMGVKGTIQLK